MDQTTQADMMPLAEASQVDEPQQPISRLLLIMGAILLMILPFVTTFNEFLTRAVENLGLDAFLTAWIVPAEVRMISVLLGMVGIPSQVSESTVYLSKGGLYMPVFISWNCVGWQSFILYAVTLATGLQGPFTKASKIESMVVGFLGTFLMNLVRMTSVAIVAYYFGHMPAILYHDYGGTIIILVWLFCYWWFSHGWLLEPLEQLPETKLEERFLKEIYAADADAGAGPDGRGVRSAWLRLRSRLQRLVHSGLIRKGGRNVDSQAGTHESGEAANAPDGRTSEQGGL